MSKVKVILFRETVTYCKKLAQFSLLSVNPYFLIDVFNKYKTVEDFIHQYLEIERGKNE